MVRSDNMSLREKINNLKEILTNYRIVNRDYEFETNLEDHPLGEQEIYRLYYINYHRIGEGRGSILCDNIGVIDWPLKPFMLPRGMAREEGFKVLSYLIDYIERTLNLDPGSGRSVIKLDEVLTLERLGFRRLDMRFDCDSNDIINLFTVAGRLLLFKKSKYYCKYFEWYTEGVSYEEVKDIYRRCGIDFDDLEFRDKLVLQRER